MSNINSKRLFNASCIALTVTAMTFAIRAGILGQLGTDFGLNDRQLGYINQMAFWGFPWLRSWEDFFTTPSGRRS